MSSEEYIKSLIDAIDAHTPPLPAEPKDKQGFLSPQEQEMNRLKERVSSNHRLSLEMQSKRGRVQYEKRVDKKRQSEAYFKIGDKIICVDFTRKKD